MSPNRLLIAPLLVASAATLVVWTDPVGAFGDPTRPPSFERPATAATAAAAAAAAVAAAASAVPPPPPPVVQSIRVSRDGEPSALVSGRLVRVGDRLGDAVIAAIDADGLTLRHERGTERLPMWPAGRLTRAPEPPKIITPSVTTAGSR